MPNTYNTSLQNNNSDLEAILETIQSLPSGGGTGGAVNAVLKSEITDEKAMYLVLDFGFVDPVADQNGFIFTDENGAIYSL